MSVEAVIAVALVAFLLGFPLWLAMTSPRRGLGTRKPKHPFRIPQGVGWFLPTGGPGTEDKYSQEYLNIPPIDPASHEEKHGSGQ
jgi:hypothetical protein